MEILESQSTVQLLFQLGGLSQWVWNRKNWTLRISRILETYTIFVILGSVALLLYGFFTDDDYNKTSDYKIGQTVDFIQMTGIRLAHIVSISEAIVRRHDLQRFYEQVREIDRIFECSLNSNVNNRKFRRRTQQCGVIMILIYVASQLFILATKLIFSDRNFLLYWTLYSMPFFICGLRYFQILTAIMIIKRRFDKLIAQLAQIDLLQKNAGEMAKIDDGEPSNLLEPIKIISPIFESVEHIHRRGFGLENLELKRLLIVRDLYNRLWELTSIVNRCFGVSILINVGNDFISITTNCYWIFLNFKQYSTRPTDCLLIAGSAVWCVPHLFNMLVLAIISERTVHSTSDIALGLHRVKIDVLNDNHNTAVNQFSLQLLHQKMAFTAAGFFNVDCTLLYTIVGATTTYLIILIQFHMNVEKAPGV